MRVHALTIPHGLSKLIAANIWPDENTPWQEINRQSFYPILGPDAAHALSPHDDRIIMMKPPFHTIADEVAGGNLFRFKGVTNPDEIDYNRAVIIADFGMGSDSPIILYYSDMDNPVVMYLRWSGNGPNIKQSWVRTHDSFDDFARAIGLITPDA